MNQPSVTTVVADASTAQLPTSRAGILNVFGRNTFWIWLDLGAVRIANLLAGFFLIRYLGPSEFGLYSMACAFGFVVNAVSDLGLTRYTPRAVSANSTEGRPILALSLATTAAFGIVQTALLVAAVAIGSYRLEAIAAGLLLFNIEGTAILCSTMLTGNLRSRQILPGSVLSMLGIVTLTILAITFHWSVVTFLTLGVLRVCVLLYLRLWQLRDFWPSREMWRWAEFRRVTLASLPYFSYNLTQVGYIRISVICFGLVASQTMVGIFSAAFVLSDIFPQWSYAVSGGLLPVWTRLYENKRISDLLDLRESILEVLLFVSIPVAVSLSVFAPEICQFLGPRFAASSPVLRIIAYRALLSAIDGFLGHGFLIAINEVKRRQRAQAVSLIVLASLTLLLGHFYGPLGVAVALFISDVLLLAQYAEILSRLKLTIRCPFLIPSLLAGALMAFTSLRIYPGTFPVLRGVAGLLVYATVLLLVSRRQLLGASRTVRHCLGGA